MKTLIVEDAPAIIATLRPVLESIGHEVLEATTGRQALATLQRSDVDLVLLDLGLPDADGVELIDAIKRGAQPEIIVLSARHIEADKIRALDEGADDYIDKPFSMNELLARIRVAERHRASRGTPECDQYRSGELAVDITAREVMLMGERVHLSPKEFALFEVLVRNSGQIVTQRRLMIAGWNDPSVDSQYLRSYISMLRGKLEENPSEPRLILTESGIGYRLAETMLPFQPDAR